MKYVFDITPRPALRRNRSDDWLLRTPDHKLGEKHVKRKHQVQAFYAYMNELRALALEQQFQLPDVLNIFFVMPMPPSWPKKKREEMNGQPHEQTPDLDNLIKSFKDTITYRKGLAKSDAHVYAYGMAVKFWGEEGKIIVIKPDEQDAKDYIRQAIQEVQEDKH